MRNHRQSLPRFSTAFRLVASLFVAMARGGILKHATSAALATGSVTVRVYLCPDNLSLVAVQQSTAPGPLLAACKPFDGGFTYPGLRTAHGGPPAPSEPFAPGLLLWPTLEFGDHAFGAIDRPSGFGGPLITNGSDVPMANQERVPISISSATIHVETRFYFFSANGG